MQEITFENVFKTKSYKIKFTILGDKYFCIAKPKSNKKLTRYYTFDTLKELNEFFVNQDKDTDNVDWDYM